jgi:hypothetical protein
MDDMLGASIPAETNATCQNCAMLVEDEKLIPSGYTFDQRSKCCTYIPEIPNFLVGKILDETEPSMAYGRAQVAARVQHGQAVTPFGLGRPPGYMLLYRQVSEYSFGKNQALRCPYFDQESGGNCGVHRHRDSTCATWYCKHVRGAVGLTFWRSLHHLLQSVERSLTAWCIYELDPGIDATLRLFPPYRTNGMPTHSDWMELLVNAGVSEDLWGSWTGRVEEFYRECARLVDALSWADVRRICGPEVANYERMVREQFRKLLSDEVPKRLRVGQLHVLDLDPDAEYLWSYSNLDPLRLPRPVLDLLHHFDGRDNEEALAEIRAKEGVTLGPEHLRALADFQVLIPVEKLVRDSGRKPKVE